MRLKRGTKKKLFQLIQMLAGIIILKALDSVSGGNTFFIILKLLVTVYIIYLVIALLYGRPSDQEDDGEHQKLARK